MEDISSSTSGTPQSENSTAVDKEYRFEFTGKGLEFFQIWIVNIILSLITLGIYSAWAKVRTNKYFYGNTVLDGSAFDYTADPKKILVGRIIAVTLFIIYQVTVTFFVNLTAYVFCIILLIVPAIMVLSMSFRMRYSNWRGISFRFQRDFKKAYLLMSPIMLYMAIAVLTPFFLGINDEVLLQQQEDPSVLPPGFGLYLGITLGAGLIFMCLFPLWQKYYYQFMGNRVFYGKAKLSFNATAWSFYSIYVISFFILILAGILIAIISGAVAGYMGAAAAATGIENDSTEVIALSIMGFMILPYFFIIAFIQTKLTNVIYSGLSAQNVVFRSELKVGRMLWLFFTNTLAIIFTLGLAMAWVKVRMARYRAQTMILVTSDFHQFEADTEADVAANSDAISDIFDLDIGL